MIQRWLCVLAFLVLSIYSPGDCSAQDANTDADLKRVRASLQETSPKLAADFEKRLKQSQREVEQYKKGHVIFGQIQLEDSKDPRSVVSQMIVLENGFFVDAVGEAGKPIGFRMHGYESVTVTPKGPGPLENLGIIRLKPLPENRLASAKGRLTIEPHADVPSPDKVIVSWQFPADPINTPHNGTEGITPFYPEVQSKVAAEGTFEVTRMSPGKYTLYIKAPNCVQQFREVELVEGKPIELAPVRLEIARQMNVEFSVSKEGDFTNAKFKKATLKADDRWRASDDTPPYGFDLLIAQKDGKLLFDHRYGPCHIEDLGAAKVTDELEVDLDKLEAKQPRNVPIEEGHVYVILQSSWKHWILVRTTELGIRADANRR